ncbi:uncharacterized protein LOC124308712 [Neodiprion virginianus]|uniref:uncharacterized protein LOC124308712 n=1 Tax=Neodiprion virginianus TaxID=2961670 RepID=UPI001EE6EF2E|nr:uncharacterized protein LOC124308712 [Neodiprion virginianus]
MTMAVRYPLLVILLMDLNFCTSLGYLREKFRRLNEVLRELAQKLSALCTKKTRLQLSENSEKARPIYGINGIEAEGFSRRASYLLSEIQYKEPDTLFTKSYHRKWITNFKSRLKTFQYR